MNENIDRLVFFIIQECLASKEPYRSLAMKNYWDRWRDIREKPLRELERIIEQSYKEEMRMRGLSEENDDG